MKKLFLILICSAFFSVLLGGTACRAQTPCVYNATNFFGGANNRSVTIYLRTGTALFGNAIIPGIPHTFPPTNGTFTCTLLGPLVYMMHIDGAEKDFPMPIPNTTNVINLFDAVNQGLLLDQPRPSIAAGTNISLTTNYVAGAPVIVVNDLSTNQVITLSGDATGSGSNAIIVTLASVTTGATATKVTYDAKGRVINGTSLTATDVPNLDASKITSGTLLNSRLPSSVSFASITLQHGGSFSSSTGGVLINDTDDSLTVDGPLIFATGTVPTGVTVGTTPPDAWLNVTMGGTTYHLPAWTNH